MSAVNKVISGKNSKFAHTLKILLVLTVILSSVRAQHVLEEINRESIKLPSWEERKIKDFIDSLKNRTVDETTYDETLTYDEPGVVPELPVLKVFDSDDLKVGQEITAACVSRNGNPPAVIVWFLGDDKIEVSLEFEEETEDASVSSVISVIQRNVTAEDDYKNLVCQAWHPGYATNVAEAKQRLVVDFAPVDQPTKVISGAEIGDSIDISLSFRSNPKPSSLIWLVGDRKVYYGTKASKYVSREISAVGDNHWLATLHIINLTHHDTLLNYTLRVKNALGGADYHLRFDAGGDDTAETEVEATETGVETTETEVESTTLDANIDESDDEITTIEVNQILQENESDEVIQIDDTTTESDSESDTTEDDKDYETEIEGITTEVNEIGGVLMQLDDDNDKFLTYSVENRQEMEETSAVIRPEIREDSSEVIENAAIKEEKLTKLVDNTAKDENKFVENLPAVAILSRYPVRNYSSILRSSTKPLINYPSVRRNTTKSTRNYSSMHRNPTKSPINYSIYSRKSTKPTRNFSPSQRTSTKSTKNNSTVVDSSKFARNSSTYSRYSTNSFKKHSNALKDLTQSNANLSTLSQGFITSSPEASPEPLETSPSLLDVKSNNTDSKVKVQKVLIYKRPVFKNTSEATTESMVTISRTHESETFLGAVESTLIDVTAKAIIFWKTSLMVVTILVLIASLSYYRRRIIRLKAEIIQKNLGNSYNQSCSSPQSSNAYTPTYFPRRCAINGAKYPNILDSDYESSARSRSNYYSQTYNSASLHSYESIDDQSNEHIYAEIGVRKASITSIDSNVKPNNYDENNSVTIHVDYDHLDYSQSFETKAWHHYQPLLIRVSEAEKPPHEMESTYI